MVRNVAMGKGPGHGCERIERMWLSADEIGVEDLYPGGGN